MASKSKNRGRVIDTIRSCGGEWRTSKGDPYHGLLIKSPLQRFNPSKFRDFIDDMVNRGDLVEVREGFDNRLVGFALPN